MLHKSYIIITYAIIAGLLWPAGLGLARAQTPASPALTPEPGTIIPAPENLKAALIGRNILLTWKTRSYAQSFIPSGFYMQIDSQEEVFLDAVRQSSPYIKIHFEGYEDDFAKWSYTDENPNINVQHVYRISTINGRTQRSSSAGVTLNPDGQATQVEASGINIAIGYKYNETQNGKSNLVQVDVYFYGEGLVETKVDSGEKAIAVAYSDGQEAKKVDFWKPARSAHTTTIYLDQSTNHKLKLKSFLENGQIIGMSKEIEIPKWDGQSNGGTIDPDNLQPFTPDVEADYSSEKGCGIYNILINPGRFIFCTIYKIFNEIAIEFLKFSIERLKHAIGTI